MLFAPTYLVFTMLHTGVGNNSTNIFRKLQIELVENSAKRSRVISQSAIVRLAAPRIPLLDPMKSCDNMKRHGV